MIWFFKELGHIYWKDWHIVSACLLSLLILFIYFLCETHSFGRGPALSITLFMAELEVFKLWPISELEMCIDKLQVFQLSIVANWLAGNVYRQNLKCSNCGQLVCWETWQNLNICISCAWIYSKMIEHSIACGTSIVTVPGFFTT